MSDYTEMPFLMSKRLPTETTKAIDSAERIALCLVFTEDEILMLAAQWLGFDGRNLEFV